MEVDHEFTCLSTAHPYDEERVDEERVDEEAADYVVEPNEPKPHVASPDLNERRLAEGKLLRLAMSLVDGVRTTVSDHREGSAHLKRVVQRAANVPEVPDDPAAIVARLQQIARADDRNAAELLRLLIRFDDSAAWRDTGCRDCIMWMDRYLGIGRVAGLERLRVGRALSNLPVIESLLAVGSLSWSKVRELTRVAGPDTEASLACAALALSVTETIDLCRRFRFDRDQQDDMDTADLSSEERENRAAAKAHERRALSWRDLDGFSTRITIDLPKERAAEFLATLEFLEDELKERTREGFAHRVAAQEHVDDAASEGKSTGVGEAASATASAVQSVPTALQRRADASVLLAARALAHAGPAIAGADRYRVMLNVDVDTLRGGVTESAVSTEEAYPARERPETRPILTGHGPVSVQTARRIACDAGITVVTSDIDGEVVSVGRKTRVWPVHIRRAIQARDRCCQMPGCGATRWLDVHHVVHWADGGETSIENGLLICRSCHVVLHEGGFELQKEVTALPESVRKELSEAQHAAQSLVACVRRFRLVGPDGREIGVRPDSYTAGSAVGMSDTGEVESAATSAVDTCFNTTADESGRRNGDAYIRENGDAYMRGNGDSYIRGNGDSYIRGNGGTGRRTNVDSKHDHRFGLHTLNNPASSD